MANLGELFIQLGVIGDIKPLEDALNKAKEQIALTQTQVKLDNARAEALEKIRQATTKADTQRIAKAYQTEKQLIMQQAQEAGINRQISAHKALGQTVGKVATGFAAFIGAVIAAAVAMNKLTNDLVQSNQAFLNLTRTSDIALSTFQKWDNVGKMFGVQNAAQQIEGLNQRLFELRLTGQGARGFQLAGINPAGDAESVLEQLRGRVAGMSDTAASYLLQQMGLDPQMLHILRLGREEFEELGQTVRKYQLTPEQSKNIQQMNVQLQIAAIKLQYLKNRAVLALMPHWVKFVEWVTKGAEAIGNIIKWVAKSNNGWAVTLRVILKLLAGTIIFAGVLKGIPLILKGIAAGITIVRTALTALTAHPIVAAITAIIGAIMLLVDDINHYLNGGGSLIGVIAKGLEDLDIKGFLDFPVPKWLEYLIKVIDFFRGGGKIEIANYNERRLQEDLKDNNIVKIKHKDGSYAYADVPPEFLGQVTGGAAGVPPNGYEGTLPDLSHRGIVSPATEQIINNNNNTVSSTTSNPQITQTNYIQTNQPANDIERELRFINAQFA